MGSKENKQYTSSISNAVEKSKWHAEQGNKRESDIGNILIIIATSMIAFTSPFVGDSYKLVQQLDLIPLLLAAWIFHSASIVVGIFVHLDDIHFNRSKLTAASKFVEALIDRLRKGDTKVDPNQIAKEHGYTTDADSTSMELIYTQVALLVIGFLLNFILLAVVLCT